MPIRSASSHCSRACSSTRRSAPGSHGRGTWCSKNSPIFTGPDCTPSHALASQHRSGQGVRVPVAFCFICEKHRSSERAGYAIFENDLVYAGHIHGSENEIYLGHVVVEPKRHVEGLAALTAQEAAAIGQAVSN